MTDIQGEYYLHENGRLIYKPQGVRDPNSSFVRRIWQAEGIGRTPTAFVDFLAEARALGAAGEEIDRLANHNNLENYVANWRHTVFGEEITHD